MKNLEYLQVEKGYEPLEHCTSPLATCEILQASVTLHLSSTVTPQIFATHISKQLAQLILFQ